ncbi:MAG TPA: FMN-binding protein [Pedococcus sp.]|nr:FMN-binding protein [Pedococcus sp.]
MRALTALGTVAAAGVVLVASWHAGQRSGPQDAQAIHVVSGASGSPAGAPGTGAPSSAGRATRPAGNGVKGATTTSAPPPRRSATGALVQTPYGNVRVRVSLLGNKITNVTAVHLTDSSPTSVEISASAEPILRREALRAQSANIDLVSGATYTSEGYQTSLQAALDAAHL